MRPMTATTDLNAMPLQSFYFLLYFSKYMALRTKEVLINKCKINQSHLTLFFMQNESFVNMFCEKFKFCLGAWMFTFSGGQNPIISIGVNTILEISSEGETVFKVDFTNRFKLKSLEIRTLKVTLICITLLAIHNGW